MKSKHRNSHLGLFIIACSLVSATQPLHATSDTWVGLSDGNWATPGNWFSTPATVPGTGDTAFFDDSGNGNTVISLGTGVAIGSISFQSNSAAYTIGAGAVNSEPLTVGSGGAVSVLAPVATSQLVNATVNLSNVAASTATFSNNGSGTLTFAGSVIGNGTGTATTIATSPRLTVQGSGNTSITGAMSIASGAHLSLFKTEAGTLTLSNGSSFDGFGAIGYQPATQGGFPLVVRQGTLLLNGGTHNVAGEAVIGGVVTNGGAGQDAKIRIDSGTFAVTAFLSVGRGNGVGAVSSDLVENNAAIVTAANFSAGFNAGNAANLSKGSITLNNTSSFTINTGDNNFFLGESAGSDMTMTLNDSSTATINTGATGSDSARQHSIGHLGTGKLVINGSATFSDLGTNAINVGYKTGAGTLTLNNGTFNKSGEIRVSSSDQNGTFTGSGTVNVNGGTLNANALTLARNNDNVASTLTAIFNQAGGIVNIANGGTLVGWQGTNSTGTINLSNGSFNQGTTATTQVELGAFGGASGTINISGGIMRLERNTNMRFSTVTSSSGTNTLNVSGTGALSFYSDAGTTLGGTGVIDLMYTAATGINSVNLNGGTMTVNQIKSTNTTGSRTFNFNGGTLKAVAANTAFFDLNQTGTHRANVRNGGAVIDNNGVAIKIVEPLLHSNIPGDNATDGGVALSGAGVTTFAGINTYTGNTTVAAASSLLLADNAGLAFKPGANGICNKVTGAGAATLDGDFTIDLTGAAVANGNSWVLVDTTTKSFNATTFTVVGFTETSSGVHQLVDGSKTWAFTESTGTLTLAVSGFASWISNPSFGLAVGDQHTTDDPDHDGISNLLEYVLGGNPGTADGSISPGGNLVGSNYVFTFKRSDLSESDTVQTVEYGSNLTVWGSYAIGASPGTAPVVIQENVPSADLDTVTVTIPTGGASHFFARLKVVK